MGTNNNHPAKGSIIEVQPITDLAAIETIKNNLRKNPRDYALFITGINTAFRACDLLQLKISTMAHIKPGDEIVLREKKTGKKRYININNAVYEATQGLIKTLPEDGNDWLFRSERTGEPLEVPTFCGMVKKWCRRAHIKGNYGSHSLRKSWGYHQRVQFKTPLYLLMKAFGHSSELVTSRYIGIQTEEMKNVFMREI